MAVELINTGSELMLGHVLNTHQQWLCRRLADLGYVVARQVAVADSRHAIELCVREALGRADLVLTTGGLGPTSDDLTRDALAQLLGKKLREDRRRKVFSNRKEKRQAGSLSHLLRRSIPMRPSPFTDVNFHIGGRQARLIL